MGAGGREQLLVAAEGEGDAVGDVEAGLFAGDLDGVDDLAGEALLAQLVVELELEGDRVAGLGLDLVAVERLQGEGDLVGAERVLVALDVDPDLSPVGHHRGDVGGVERLDRGGDLRHPLAEAGAEGAVVGLGACSGPARPRR